MQVMDYKTLKYPQIEDWCFENDKVEWLEAHIDMSFMALKYEFAKTFMPQILPVAKPKALTMREKFMARKAAAAKK
jgi:hypothetical protein